MDDLFNIDELVKQLDRAVQRKAKSLGVTPYQLSILLAAYKQLHYQNHRRDRKGVTSVTETDQNPA